jgi:hypothetical protein
MYASLPMGDSMLVTLLCCGAGALFAATAILGGLGSFVTLHGVWPRAAFGLVGAEFLYLAALASRISKRASGEPAGSLSEERANHGRALARQRMRRRMAGLGLTLSGACLAVLGTGLVAIESIALSEEGGPVLAVMGGLLVLVGGSAFLPDEASRREQQRLEREKAAAAVPGGPRPCAVCGSHDFAVGVRVRANCESIGKLSLCYEPNEEEEPVVGDVCRRCGSVRLRVCRPDRDWTVG